jgi:hypothetical protein
MFHMTTTYCKRDLVFYGIAVHAHAHTHTHTHTYIYIYIHPPRFSPKMDVISRNM